MSAVLVDLDAELIALLGIEKRPIEEAAREMIVLELFRRGSISSGKAAELLNRSRTEFLEYADHLGLSFFDMSAEEWDIEKSQSEAIDS